MSPAIVSLPGAPEGRARLRRGSDLPEPDPFLRLTSAAGAWRVASGRRVLHRGAGAAPRRLLTACLDLGTTNISLQLLDLARPALLGTATTLNPQTAWGDDVLSRVQAASLPGGLAALRRSVLGAVGGLIEELRDMAGVRRAPVYELTLAANPAMAAIFLGRDVSSLARPPYAAPALPSAAAAGRSFGLPLHREAVIRVLPALGPFVGGDVTAGLVRTGVLPGERRRVFFLDLGTNGEMVVFRRGRYLATSAAAGPALEGRRLSCGMKAEEGAIEEVTVREDVSFKVIGGGRPRGLCGSGLLDLLLGLGRAGVIRPDGRLLSGEEAAHFPRPRLAARMTERQGERAFLLSPSPSRGIYLTQADVRELQLAKGAIRAGTHVLLSEAGLEAGEVERVVVAGTFGYHLDAASLTGTGFLPGAWRDRLDFVGNASLDGARQCGLYRGAFRLAREIPRRTKTINLAEHPRFRETFLDHLDFEE